MEYYDEVVEIEDKPGNIRPIVESGVIGKAIQDDMELNKPPVNILSTLSTLRMSMVKFSYKGIFLGKRSTKSPAN